MRKGIIFSFMALAVISAMLDLSPEADPPNLVLLFADDLGYGDLGCFGHPTIRTAHLDKMAQEGIKLTSFYAAPSCTPSRAALLTGRYPLRSGLPRVLGPGAARGIPASEITLAEALKSQNYRTIAIGKWHLGHQEEKFFPTSNGFDKYFGLLYSNDMQPPWVQTDVPLKLWRDTQPVEYPIKQATLTKRYTEEAVKFITESKDGPFFLYLAYTMVHVPLHASESFSGRSRRGLYGDVVEEIDWSVGCILEVLKQEGLDENTLVVFTSDNGPWLHMPDRMFRQDLVKQWDAGSAGLLRGWKGSTYEGGVRVPFIARWPSRIPPAQVSAEMASTMDLYTTFLILAGAEIPRDRPVDGKNIMPLLEGGTKPPRDSFYYYRGETLEGIRKGKWKLRLSNHLREDIPQDQPHSPELYDLDLDPSEMYNLADQYPEIVTRLRAQMDEFEKEMEASLKR
ncbi:sulfatase [Acidobacteria bacterium AH-259-A15]|nr:sulfatase [Acidobacteria bacterium AH-259-A15]